MENITCKTCGGSVTRVGNYYVCESCRNKWEIDSANDVHAVERANAWAMLRDGDFEKAAQLFENIILKDAKNHEAYWGRALAEGGIIYVTDWNETKKVPTCNNITEDSFLASKDVKKAISLAPSDIAQSYEKQAEQIEKIRIEWLEKASKEPAYDVFISFKDSDRENGIERTQDSIDAQDLYNALVAEGYRVFFSRISLRDKISEQYEPYIYNAIKTAKVMIVFGEKAEYFSSVWIKNEWSRFKTRIEKGEKHKNSLVVVYKNMNPGDLPTVLKSRQCLNAADMTFLPGLTRHIKRVVEESKQAVHLEKISVQGGQVSKKAAKIEHETIHVREIGAGAVAEVSISEKQQMGLASSYLQKSLFEDAEKIIDDVLFNNPNNPDALWKKLLAKNRCATNSELKENTRFDFSDEDLGLIEKTLNCSSKEKAAQILNFLYQADEIGSEKDYARILKTILPYQFEDREKRIAEDFATAIEKCRFNVFTILLGTLRPDDVEKYVQYHLDFAESALRLRGYSLSEEYRKKCADAVLKVDSGNLKALEILFQHCWNNDGTVEDRIHILEEMLKYSTDVDKRVLWALDYADDSMCDPTDADFAIAVLKYYTQPLSTIKDDLISLAASMVGCIRDGGCRKQAEYVLGLILSFAPNEPEVYWNLCLLKAGASDEETLIESPVFLKQIPEYTKYLTLVDNQRRDACIDLAQKQIAFHEALRRKKEKAKKIKKAFRIGILISAAVIISALALVLTFGLIIPSNNYKKAEEYFAQGNYLEAYKYYEKANNLKDSWGKILEIREKAPKVAEQLAAEGKYLEAYNYLMTAGSSETTIREGYLAASQGKYSEAAKKGVKHIIIPEGTTEIKDYAFASCYRLESITIPDSVTSIGDYAFNGCSSLTSITIPDSVASIGNYAFQGCSSLTSITIPDSVTSIGDGAFDNCSELTSVTIPDSVTSIGNYAFRWCSKLNSVSIPNSVTSLSNVAFSGCSSLTSITIPDSVTSIGDSAFEDCASLESITVPFIGESKDATGYKSCFGYVFGYTSSFYSYSSNPYHYYDSDDRRYYTFDIPLSLNTVTISDSFTSIDSSAFSGCAGLTSITIPDSVTSIGDSAFYGCTGLTSITIPGNVTSIGVSAFYGCTSLTSIVIPCSVDTIGSNAFAGCSKLAIYCEAISKPIGWDSDWNSSMRTVTWAHNNVITHNDYNYVVHNGKAFLTKYKGSSADIVIPATIDGYDVVYFGDIFYLNATIQSVVIPENVTSIGAKAFQGCSSLTSITIPDSVISIGDSAFRWCSKLNSVSIPNSVTSIGNEAFYGCSSLTSITIPNSVTSIGESAFTSCSKLTSIIMGNSVTNIGDSAFRYCSQLTSITIPDSVISIGDFAFENCSSLTSITMGNSVTNIGDSAFQYCSQLVSIIIPKSVITIGEYAFSGCSQLTIYCEALSEADEWNRRWNYSSRPIVWGYTENN